MPELSTLYLMSLFNSFLFALPYLFVGLLTILIKGVACLLYDIVLIIDCLLVYNVFMLGSCNNEVFFVNFCKLVAFSFIILLCLIRFLSERVGGGL